MCHTIQDTSFNQTHKIYTFTHEEDLNHIITDQQTNLYKSSSTNKRWHLIQEFFTDPRPILDATLDVCALLATTPDVHILLATTPYVRTLLAATPEVHTLLVATLDVCALLYATSYVRSLLATTRK
jgi:hypothetical protein